MEITKNWIKKVGVSYHTTCPYYLNWSTMENPHYCLLGNFFINDINKIESDCPLPDWRELDICEECKKVQ